MNKLLPYLVVSLFFLSLIPIGSCDVTVYAGDYFYVGNETYGVTQTMIFSYIQHNSAWIKFNTTDFNVTSANNIYINLSFLHEDISTAVNNTLLLQFNASTTSGTVWFNISGFVPSSQYYYQQAGGVGGGSINADGSGMLSFSHSSWSEVMFEIYASYAPGDPSGYTNITQPPINATASPTLIEVMGNFNVGNYTTNTSVDVYAPSNWTVSFVNMSFLTATGAIDQNITATTYTQYNATHRRYNCTYNPSNTLLDADMGNFSVNVSAVAYNLTHRYDNWSLLSDVFEVYRLNNPYNITALYNQTYHGLNFTWSGGGNITYLTLKPTGDAGTNDWDVSPAVSDHYTCVDEIIYNEGDYLYYYPIHSYFIYDMFEMANHTTEAGEIVNVTATYIARSTPYAGALIHPRIDIGGATYYGNEITVSSTSYTSYSYTWELNPDTDTNWTWSDIDDMEIGIGGKAFDKYDPGGGKTPRVTQIFSSIRHIGPTPSQTVAVRNNESFPVTPWNGYEIYNNTGNAFGNHPISDITYFMFYSYNDTTKSFSPGIQVNWGTLGFNCYNESNMSQAIGFDILVTNSDATETYTAADLTNTHFINLNDIPYGDDTIFVISNSSYRQRVYYYDLVANQFYNYTFYLPPITTPVDPGSGDDGGNTTETKLYLLSVVGPQNEYTSPPVEEAKITIQRYNSVTDTYTTITSVLTDANGEADVYLVPLTLYKVTITKDGYDTSISDYTPSSSLFTKTFRITPTTTTPPDYDIFWDDITFTGVMYINGTIKITYIDSNSSTVDTQVYLYDAFNGTDTLVNIQNDTGDSSFVYWVSGINTSRDHELWLYFNNTADYASVTPPVVITVFAVNKSWGDDITKIDLEQRFQSNFGPLVLGYVNVIAIIIPIILLCIFGMYNVGLGILAAGVSLGFMETFLFVWTTNAFNPLLALMCPVAIAIGFLYVMTVKGEEHV